MRQKEGDPRSANHAGQNQNRQRVARRPSQLQVFVWISSTYPVWFQRQDHRAMLLRTFDRVLSEECHE